MLMRIGLFGGTFNPIHLGHIQVSREIKEKFQLDKIYVIPSATPPHKKRQGIADAKDRLEMTRLAVSQLDGYLVSDVELYRSGPSFTVDTISHFNAILPEDAQIYWILGIDAFLEIDTWMSYKELFQKLPLIVMSRPGSSSMETEKLQEYIQNNISNNYRFQRDQNCFVHNKNQTIYFMNVTPYDISSTNIRNKIRQKMPLENLVPEKVKTYIRKKGLYL